MKRAMAILIGIALMVGFLSCSSDKNPVEPTDHALAKLTCAQCHTDQEALMALAKDEAPPSGEAGEG